MSDDFAARLAAAGGSGSTKDLPQAGYIKDFVGQTVTVTGVKVVPNKRFGGTSVIAQYVDADGNEGEFWTTPNSGRQLKAVADFIPPEGKDLKIETFESEKGSNGYKFTAV
jgi:hypothetical protein